MTDAQQHEFPMQWQDLVLAARAVRRAAYAPYSHYSVGAAVLTSEDEIFQGCNVENASYGLTICAERAAVCAAVSAGQPHIEAVCISLNGIAVPCGACRQFLFEFNPKMTVVLDNLDRPAGDLPERVLLSDLLPRGFHLD